MKMLNIEEVQQVSGGDFEITVTSHVSDAEFPFFMNVLGQILTGKVDAAAFGDLISKNAQDFTNIPIQSIKVGNFVITPAQ